MRQAKISFDTTVPYKGPQGSPLHYKVWVASNQAFWDKQGHSFGEIAKASIDVLALLGDVAMRVELIKISITEANYTVGEETGPRYIFEARVFFDGIEEKLETDPSLLIDLASSNPQENARELLRFKQALYDVIRRFTVRCTSTAVQKERMWRGLIPPPVEAFTELSS